MSITHLSWGNVTAFCAHLSWQMCTLAPGFPRHLLFRCLEALEKVPAAETIHVPVLKMLEKMCLPLGLRKGVRK